MDIIDHPATLADTGDHAVLTMPFNPGFQLHWDAWIERGRVHDRRVRHRLVVAGAVLGMTAAAVAIVYALLQ